MPRHGTLPILTGSESIDGGGTNATPSRTAKSCGAGVPAGRPLGWPRPRQPSRRLPRTRPRAASPLRAAIAAGRCCRYGARSRVCSAGGRRPRRACSRRRSSPTTHRIAPTAGRPAFTNVWAVPGARSPTDTAPRCVLAGLVEYFLDLEAQRPLVGSGSRPGPPTGQAKGIIYLCPFNAGLLRTGDEALPDSRQGTRPRCP